MFRKPSAVTKFFFRFLDLPRSSGEGLPEKIPLGDAATAPLAEDAGGEVKESPMIEELRRGKVTAYVDWVTVLVPSMQDSRVLKG